MATKARKEPKLPLFLREYRASALKELKYYAGMMGNWITIHGHIKGFHPCYSSLNVLRCMMIAEYYRTGGPRMDIIVRLHGRYQKLRYSLERVELNCG